jgi:predicted GIY-YIG superfamily endonuclease
MSKMQTKTPALRYIQMEREPCQLYRLYGDDGKLLYIGIARNAKRRIYQHRGNGTWGHMIVRSEVEDYSTRKEALAKEEALIRAERPPYNKAFTGRRGQTFENSVRRPKKDRLPEFCIYAFLDELAETNRERKKQE